MAFFDLDIRYGMQEILLSVAKTQN